MSIAKLVASRSTCSSRPVGCVIIKDNRILATGYNGPPSGHSHCIDKNTPDKLYCARRENKISNKDKQSYCKSVHAEENALLYINQYGFNDELKNSSMYITLSPCIRCIRKLHEVGINEIYYEYLYASINKEQDKAWLEEAKSYFSIFKQVVLSPSTKLKLSNAFENYTSKRIMESE